MRRFTTTGRSQLGELPGGYVGAGAEAPAMRELPDGLGPSSSRAIPRGFFASMWGSAEALVATKLVDPVLEAEAPSLSGFGDLVGSVLGPIKPFVVVAGAVAAVVLVVVLSKK